MSRLDIGRRVDEHVRPDTPALQGFAFARCCGFSSASIPHALTGKVGSGSRRFRPHAVAYDLWLPPAGSIRDLHPPPFIHARRTQSPYGLLPIPPRSLSLPTYSCVDPPPPSTLNFKGRSVSPMLAQRAEGVIFGSIMTYHVQILLLVRQPLFDRAALPLTQTSWVLPPLSVGKMTLRLYGALNYSHGLSKGPSFGTGRGQVSLPAASWTRACYPSCRARLIGKPLGSGQE